MLFSSSYREGTTHMRIEKKNFFFLTTSLSTWDSLATFPGHRIEPASLALEMWSHNHWTPREEGGGKEVRVSLCFCCFFKLLQLKIFSLLRCHIWGGACVRLYAQSWPILCDPMDYSLPGFSVHGISQARILDWVVISFSRGSSRPRDQTSVSCIFCIGRQILYQCSTGEAHILGVACLEPQQWFGTFLILPR